MNEFPEKTLTRMPVRGAGQRRGISVLKIILILPVIFVLLCTVLEIGNLWLARLELENALESAALSAVKEWGDDNGSGGTLIPRNVGADFALSNTVNGVPVDLRAIDPLLNYDNSNTAGNPNQNLNCPDGVLIFGAMTDFNDEAIFNSGERPGCFGGGDLLFDATGNGNLCADNAWGVSFRANPDPFINNNLLVTRIIIDVDPLNTGAAQFDFGTPSNPTPPVLSDNLPGPAVADQSGGSQPDNFGFANAPGAPVNQVTFSPTTGNPTQLEINFSAAGTDAGFSPGDRFRFGACVRIRQGNGPNFSQADGDEIGQIPTRVTVFFSLAGQPVPNPAVGSFFDNNIQGLDRSNDCIDPGIPFFDALGNFHLIVHGRQVVDLPCPPTSSANNNGQSFLELAGSGGQRVFAVRAQAELEVTSVCENLFGCPLGPFKVSAKSTAYYDCVERNPVLIRIDQFICQP